MLRGSWAKMESITENHMEHAVHLRNSSSSLRYQSGQIIKHEDSWLLECWRGNTDAGSSQSPLLLLLTSGSPSLEQISPLLWENSKCTVGKTNKKKANLQYLKRWRPSGKHQGVGLVLQAHTGMNHPCLHLEQQQRQRFINTFALLLPSIPQRCNQIP